MVARRRPQRDRRAYPDSTTPRMLPAPECHASLRSDEAALRRLAAPYRGDPTHPRPVAVDDHRDRRRLGECRRTASSPSPPPTTSAPRRVLRTRLISDLTAASSPTSATVRPPGIGGWLLPPMSRACRDDTHPASPHSWATGAGRAGLGGTRTAGFAVVRASSRPGLDVCTWSPAHGRNSPRRRAPRRTCGIPRILVAPLDPPGRVDDGPPASRSP